MVKEPARKELFGTPTYNNVISGNGLLFKKLDGHTEVTSRSQLQHNRV